MNKYLKIVLFGFLVWLIPFTVSFLVFPLKATRRPLFESIMPLVLSIVVITFAYYYMKNISIDYVKEGILIGIIWFIINIAIDLFMFLPPSPMQMGISDYMMDIGIIYLMIPAITIGIGYMAQNKAQ